MINVGIIGVSGFSGLELVKILIRHRSVNIAYIAGDFNAGKFFSDLFPQFINIFDLNIEKVNLDKISDLDVLFLCLPHTKSMEIIKNIDLDKTPVIDLSADFRLRSKDEYKKWYGCEHVAPSLLEHSVYGLCELNRSDIQNARIVANPGCYPTSALLALLPVVGIINLSSVIIDSKSGASGAGRSYNKNLQFCDINENFKTYAIVNHRHTPEIENVLSQEAKKKVNVTFSVHLLPVQRGILSTIYADLNGFYSYDEIMKIYTRYYENETFIRIRNDLPEINDVIGTNFCDIAFRVDDKNNRLVIVSVIDNLIKGASGQAVQNMNIMFRFKENDGLLAYPFYP